MAIKSRYLQVSDVMMFEMTMLGENDNTGIENPSMFTYLKLRDGHTVLLSPVSCECELDTEYVGGEKYKKRIDPTSLNNLNHLAVPKDSQCSLWYNFLDPDYNYVDASIMDVISENQIKAKEYEKYLQNPLNPEMPPYDSVFDYIPNLRWDTVKLYFVNGYDFSNIGGLLMRITVDGEDTSEEIDRKIDLCDFFITKSNAYKLLNYMSTPIMFGNNIYDRYIEVNVACLYDLINNTDFGGIYSELNIKQNTTMKLSFSYVLDNEMDVEKIEYNITELLNNDVVNDNINCTFTRSSILNGTIPTTTITSDNLGAYISECPDMPYFMFYATWRDNPLTCDTVWRFNKGIRLYDNSLVRRGYDYEVDQNYTAETDMKKWICVHEIKCSLCMGEEVIKEETYSMTQIFVSRNDPSKFYYRPVIFDEIAGMYIDNIQIVYTMRFMNVNDKVQFMKVATLSMGGNMSRFFSKGTSLKISQITPYKIYNKVVENKHEHTAQNTGVQKTKYIKVFYSSTEVVLDDDGNLVTGDYNYTLNISQAPKSYKFVFKKLADNGTYSYMDMSNSYYKLMFKDQNGADVFIEPTYSTNMNIYFGELEFNINTANLNKLNAVDDNKKLMSIVAFNEDGSISSMFDFKYNTYGDAQNISSNSGVGSNSSLGSGSTNGNSNNTVINSTVIPIPTLTNQTAANTVSDR